MTWEAVTAIAASVSAVVVAVAAVAAIMQLRHLRLAYQLESCMQLMNALQSSEMVEARRYVESLDLYDTAALQAALAAGVDPRITTVGVHYQTVARLINLGVLEGRLFAPHLATAPRVWQALQPLAYALRERLRTPIWMDIEYLVWRIDRGGLIEKLAGDYPREFLAETNIAKSIARNQVAANEAARIAQPR